MPFSQHWWRRTTVTAGAALLLLFVLLVSVSAAPSARQLQRQRLHAFTKYAERVGAALDLFTNGPATPLHDTEDAHRMWGSPQHPQEEENSFGPSERTTKPSAAAASAHPAMTAMPTDTGFSALSMLTQCMQYPHQVVRAALAAATEKAAAARTVAAALSNAQLSEEEEMKLAQVRAATERADAAAGRRAASDAALAATPSAMRRARAAAAAAAAQAATTSAARPASAARGVAALADSSVSDNYITCNNGYVAIAASERVSCPGYWYMTAGDWATLPDAVKPTCELVHKVFWGLPQECICPIDTVMIRNTDRIFTCATRPVDVQVLLDDAYLCNNTADAALGLPGTMESEYCLQTTRNAKLNLPVRWRYSYLSLDALRAAVDTNSEFIKGQESPSNSATDQWVVLGRVPPSGLMGTAETTPYAKGNYSQLAVNPDLFSYLTPLSATADAEATAAGLEPFYISGNSSLYNATAFHAVYCFSAPRKTKEHLVETPLTDATTMAKYFGNMNGTSSQTLELDLSTISDDFIEGNQMYVETGVQGGSSVYTYRVARLHLSFSDLAAPSAKSHHYKKQFNPLYILLIVAIGVIVLGGCLAALWYHLMRREEYDDNLVSNAQRNKGKKTAQN